MHLSHVWSIVVGRPRPERLTWNLRILCILHFTFYALRILRNYVKIDAYGARIVDNTCEYKS